MPHYNIPNATTNMQTSDDHSRLLRTHFNNINMLCDIIRDSQSILEYQQRNMNNNHRRNNYTGSNIFNSAFDSPSGIYNNINETVSGSIAGVAMPMFAKPIKRKPAKKKKSKKKTDA